MEVRIELTKTPKAKPADQSALSFGHVFTDHMFLMNYSSEKGWFDARVVPYAPLQLDPATTSLHYGQLVFEGMKAYKTEDNRTVLFRPQENMKRLNVSNDRLCIPQINEEDALHGLCELLKVEEAWIPTAPGTSLYIRPFIISTDAFLGVHPSDTYLFIIILSPVGPYYKEGLAPVRINVETQYVRAVPGGTGHIKCAGNYAASLKGQVEAGKKGYSQVLWLDGAERKYVDEVGAMNVFFVVDGELITSSLTGGILPGITRKSIIELAKSWGLKVTERKIAITELVDAYKAGKLDEAFGTGTAAVISPIGELNWGDVSMKLSDGKIGALSQRFYDELVGIQLCKREDKFGWIYEVK
ncbi:branched-chain amino acid aminotransferase [Oscillospiraceae bacterium MB08-C2-2]|nr:branched-chain amino acid aminotransferase [Oscillospiraceae bacterium MB08-C2-2]